MSGQKKLGYKVLLFFLGLLLFLATIMFSGIDSLTMPETILILPIFGSVVISILMVVILTERWRSIVLSLSPANENTRPQFYGVVVAALFSGYLIPKEIADLGGRTIWLSRQRGSNVIGAASSIFLDRSFDIWVLLVVLPVSVAHFTGVLSSYFGIGVALSGVIVLMLLPLVFDIGRAINSIVNRIRITGSKFISRFFNRKTSVEEAQLVSNLPNKTIGSAIVLTALKFLLLAIRNVLFAYAVVVNIAPDVLLFGTPLSQATFIFSFTAGGLGVLEAGWLAILTAAHQTPSMIPIFIVAQRVLSMLSDGIAFLIVLAVSSAFKKTGKTHKI